MVEDLPSSSSLGHRSPWQKPDQMKMDLWELWKTYLFGGIGISNISASFENSLKRFLGDVFYLPLVVVSEYVLRREQMHKEETLCFSPAKGNSLIIFLRADSGMLFLLLSHCKPTHPVLIPIVTKVLCSGVLASLQCSLSSLLGNSLNVSEESQFLRTVSGQEPDQVGL